MTLDHVWGCSWCHVCLISLKFSDNVGMILIFIWYFLKKKLRWTSSPKTVHFKCMKTLGTPLLWCRGSICHQFFTFIQIGCGHTVKWYKNSRFFELLKHFHHQCATPTSNLLDSSTKYCFFTTRNRAGGWTTRLVKNSEEGRKGTLQTMFQLLNAKWICYILST